MQRRSNRNRSTRRLAWLATGLAMTAAGCSGSSAGSSASAPTSVPTTAAPTTAGPTPSALETPAASPTPAAPAVDQTIRVSYASAHVTRPAARVKVKLNSRVALVVTSDVADEIHLHGYDKSVDVAKGGTATLVFKASVPGVFEVELESRKRRLLQLQVQ